MCPVAAGKPSRPLVRPLPSVLAVVAAMALHLSAQVGMLVIRPEWSLSRFRAYFPFDQLSYMTMVENASRGDYRAIEPLTESGSNFYPRAWYLLLGTIARIFNLHPATAWQAGGLAIQVILVAAIAVTIIVLSRRPWLGLLAPVPFVLGTFASFTGGGWFTQMGSHAVLWGPFGVLYTLNGEAASLSIAGIALMLLLLAWARPASRRFRITATLVAAATIGALANVQTYSFIAAVYLAVMVTAVWALVKWRSRIAIVVSVGLFPVLFIVGPLVFSRFGQLPALVFGLLPAIPGLLVLLRKTGPIVLAYFGVAVLTAMPQVVATVAGIVSGDPFLAYRVASNRNLGVEPLVGIASAVVILLPLFALALAGHYRKRPLWTAFALGAPVAWFVLATNDRWGPNAEPYRLWIDSFLLVAVCLLPLAVAAVVDVLPQLRADLSARIPRARLRAAVAGITIGVVTVAAGVSAVDWVRFFQDDAYHSTWDFEDARATAQADLAAQTRDGGGQLLGVDSCIDPQILKINSGSRIAFYNLGMAWPEERDAVQTFLENRSAGTVDRGALDAANIGWIMTDASCAADWPSQMTTGFEEVDRASSDEYEFVLWKVTAE